MSQIHVAVARVIAARPETIYAVISDYRVGHPAILPKRYFTDYAVEQGGQGAGTAVRVTLKAFGSVNRFRLEVSEPEPGRVLAERDVDGGAATTFTLEPLAGGQQTNVTIATDFPGRSGLAGGVEKWIKSWVTQRIYAAELEQLAGYVRGRQA